MLQGWSSTLSKLLRYGESVGQEMGSRMGQTALGHRVLFMRRRCRYGVRGGYWVGGGCGLLGSGTVVLWQRTWARVISVGCCGGFRVRSRSGNMGWHDGADVWAGGRSGAMGLRWHRHG